MRHVPYAIARAASPRDVVGLLYHALGGRRLPWVEPLYACKSAEAFARDLAFLEAHFHPVDDAAIAAAREGGPPLPPRAVAVTFDDGLAEAFHLARPLLLRNRIPCTFFVVTGVLDNRAWMWRSQAALCLAQLAELRGEEVEVALERLAQVAGAPLASAGQAKAWLLGLEFAERGRLDGACEALGVRPAETLARERPYLTTAQVAALRADGFTIGAHTVNHPRLHRLPGFVDVEREIVESCAAVRAITGQSRVPVAFPFNGRTLDRGRLAELRRREPSISLFYDTNRLMRDAPFVVNRIPVDSPVGDGPRGSNLALLLREAHLLEPLRALRRLGSLG